MFLRSTILLLLVCLSPGGGMARASDNVDLPRPSLAGESSLEQLLAERRSIRDYPDQALQLAELGQLLWAAQGITHPEGLRTAPSAGALYPLELYVAAGQVDGLAPGIYHYRPEHHRLVKTADGDVRTALARAALSQNWIADASAVIVFTAVYERTMRKYGDRGIRYVHMETGHAAQNLFLQAGALDLATVVVGAFHDAAVADLLRLPADVQPQVLMPVGRK